MEKDYVMDDVAERMEAMKKEIESLKEQLAEKAEEKIAQHAPELYKIKDVIEEGFAKIADAARPMMEAANHKIAEPAKAAASKMEEHIVIHPFASLICAIGAGFLIGKMMGIAETNYVRSRENN